MKQRIDIGKRKHASQMTDREKQIIWKKLKGVQLSAWKPTNHTLERLEEKGIEATIDDLKSTIYNSDIVEYRITYNKRTRQYDERVIVRAKSIVNRCYNLNVVFSITNKKIVTTWINHINDFHTTLDWSIYSEDMQVIGA